MSYFMLSIVYLLMVSVGMSLKPAGLGTTWRTIPLVTWLRILFATFIVPPAVALILATLFRLTIAETAGLYMIAVAPGAPMLARNLSRKGFDVLLAATYQLWSALMIPIMVPILVFAAGELYGRHVWIFPPRLLPFIVTRQLLPLTIGMLLGWKFPKQCERARETLNLVGNVGLAVAVVLILVKVAPSLARITPTVPVAAVLLALSCIAVFRLYRVADPVIRGTFAVCNANRNGGLALLLVTNFKRGAEAVPTIACYILLAFAVMVLYVRLFPAVVAQSQKARTAASG